MQKGPLWPESVSYQKNNGCAWPRPSFSWYETCVPLEVSEFETALAGLHTASSTNEAGLSRYRRSSELQVIISQLGYQTLHMT